MPVVRIDNGVAVPPNVVVEKNGTPAQTHLKWTTNDQDVIYTVNVPENVLADGQALSFEVSLGNPSDNFQAYSGATVKVENPYSITGSGAVDFTTIASPPTIMVEE